MHIGKNSCVAFVPLSLTVASCAPVGPPYTAPEIHVSGRWQAQDAGPWDAGTPDAATLARWWNTLDDPVLTDVESRVLEANKDLKVAVARVREARVVLGAQ
ncbi:hypothetical protein [Desulfosoma sp.]|uniref:hypothetical protein n=1 Tax=Desulfosoma sp. TaxID=2603217 RepID=UPI004048F5B9